MKPWQALLAIATVLLGLVLLAACTPPPYRPLRPLMSGDTPGRPSVRGFFFVGPRDEHVGVERLPTKEPRPNFAMPAETTRECPAPGYSRGLQAGQTPELPAEQELPSPNSRTPSSREAGRLG